jgi:hypothetical protein
LPYNEDVEWIVPWDISPPFFVGLKTGTFAGHFDEENQLDGHWANLKAHWVTLQIAGLL